MFSKELNKKLDRYHLLTHPFYQIFWNEGKLTREIIKDYAEQYYQHVKAFPRYISATHSICEDIEKTQSDTSLAVDTDTNTVKINGGEVKYKEYGNTISFEREGGGNQSFFYSFDRVAGTLQEQTWDQEGVLRFVTDYKCKRTDPLF